MRRTTLLFTILLLSAALPLVAQTPQQESLGDLARQLRAATRQGRQEGHQGLYQR